MRCTFYVAGNTAKEIVKGAQVVGDKFFGETEWKFGLTVESHPVQVTPEGATFVEAKEFVGKVEAWAEEADIEAEIETEKEN